MYGSMFVCKVKCMFEWMLMYGILCWHCKNSCMDNFMHVYMNGYMYG